MRYTLLNPKVAQAEAARFVGCTPMAVTRKLQELRAEYTRLMRIFHIPPQLDYSRECHVNAYNCA